MQMISAGAIAEFLIVLVNPGLRTWAYNFFISFHVAKAAFNWRLFYFLLI